MPHIIVEFSEEIFTQEKIKKLIKAVHHAAQETGLFKAENIKTRCIPVRDYLIGNGGKTYIHAQLRIKPGRNSLEKKLLSGSVLNAIKAMDSAVNVMTVEVVDLDDASYSKFSV